MKLRDDQLIELDEALLNEVEAGGPTLSTPDLFKKTFITPFLNVLNISRAELSKIGINVKALGKKYIEAFVTTLIPVLDADYKKIDKERVEQLDKIKQKYAESYKIVDDALEKDDVLIFSFLYNPMSFLAAGAGLGAISKLKQAYSGGADIVGAAGEYAANKHKELSRSTHESKHDLDAMSKEMQQEINREHQQIVHMIRQRMSNVDKMNLNDAQAKATRISIKQYGVKKLQNDIDKLLKHGLKSSNELIKRIQKTIEEIEAL
jgi:hypothetical protein